VQAQQQSCFDSQGQEEGDSSSESQQQFVSWEMNNTGVIASDVITLHSAMTIKYGNIFFTPSRYHRFPRCQAGKQCSAQLWTIIVAPLGGNADFLEDRTCAGDECQGMYRC
jgi:hypothetical protein